MLIDVDYLIFVKVGILNLKKLNFGILNTSVVAVLDSVAYTDSFNHWNSMKGGGLYKKNIPMYGM